MENLSEELVLVYNLGITKDTPEDVKLRFESEVNSGKRENERLLTVIAVGTNDSAYYHETGTTRVSAERFRSNLEWLIKKSKQIKSTPILVGSVGVDESKTDPLYWDSSISYCNELIDMYDSIVSEVANTERIPFVDILNNMRGRKYLLYDGLHPNAEGHRVIKDLFLRRLKDEEII